MRGRKKQMFWVLGGIITLRDSWLAHGWQMQLHINISGKSTNSKSETNHGFLVVLHKTAHQQKLNIKLKNVLHYEICLVEFGA